MKNTQLSSEWSEYNHSYEKEMQDIRTKDGKEYIKCWPNAGSWFVLSQKNTEIPDDQVTHTRLNDFF